MTKNDLENKTDGIEKEQNPEANPAPELPEVTESVIQLEDLQKQVDQYKDLLLRKAAEFDNYKRRIESETINIIKYATESLIEDLLPVLDDFERSLKHSKESTDYNGLVKGVELIYQKLIKVLDARGVKPFETIGKEFNVDYHDAVMQLSRTNVPPHTVIEVVEKGYMMDDKVIRHAKVVVSSAPINEREGADQDESSKIVSGK
jgi:molecular chaperone GrpE